MKKILALIVILATILSTAGCNTGSGSGRSRKKRDFLAKDSVYLITRITLHNYRESKTQTASYEYDDTNKLVQIIMPDYRGNPEYYSYVYDDLDNLAYIKCDGELVYNFDDSEHSTGNYQENEYDDRGNVIQRTEYQDDWDAERITYYTYNDQNKLIEKRNDFHTESYEYDEQGNLCKYSFHSKQYPIFYNCVYKYDDTTLPVEMTYYKDKEPAYTFTYEYTDNAVLISKYYYPGGNTPLVTIECNYISADAASLSNGSTLELDDILFDDDFLVNESEYMNFPKYIIAE